MARQNTKILYTYLERRSFVNTDIQILGANHPVTTFHFRSKKKWAMPFQFIRQSLFLLVFGWRVDYFICFFAGYHSFLPALFAKITGKRSCLFLGGTECFNYPSFRYGNFTRPLYGRFTCMSASLATLLVPVSGNLIRSRSDYYTADSAEQGIYHWCPGLATPHQTISLEYNPELFQKRPVMRDEKSFLSVAFGIAGTSFIRKGIDKIVMLAHSFPEYSFTIIGCTPEEFPVEIPVNMKLIPPVPYASLPGYYSAHRFYIQLSIAEGFPSAICEAMLCECIPIGSAVAAIPEIISTHGFLVPRRDDDQIRDTIRQAVAVGEKEALGKAARKHIIEQYGPGKRQQALLRLLNAKSGSPDS